MQMVTQNHKLFKSVLRQKIMCEEINKGKQVVKVDAGFKITKSYTFAVSPRFDSMSITIRQ